MIEIALYQPEIPPNTGNIIRLAANMNCILHLIKPMGFNLDSKQLKRAGLDYHDQGQRIIHASYSAFLQAVKGQRIIACTTKTDYRYSDYQFKEKDILLFGPETRGLPHDIIFGDDVDTAITIPMTANSRSLNLSNSVAIIAYEAWRQLDFIHAKDAIVSG